VSKAATRSYHGLRAAGDLNLTIFLFAVSEGGVEQAFRACGIACIDLGFSL
jgi:hypothetical protein